MSTHSSPYPKMALSCSDQVALLKQRGLVVPDEQKAIETLEHISYYRLRGYYIQWYDRSTNMFTSQRSFDDIVLLHEFDSHLASLMLEVLTVIEINLRTYIAHDMAMSSSQSATPHLDLNNYKTALAGSNMLGMIARAIIESKDREVFIQHHITNYNEVVPIWAIVEVLTLGQLSKLFSNLSPRIRNMISLKRYGQSNFEYVESWLYVAANYRNVCAHRSRLYNRMFTASKPKLPSSDNVPNSSSSTLYAGLLALKHLSCNNHFCFDWFIKLGDLIRSYSSVVDVARMGFPVDWKNYL